MWRHADAIIPPQRHVHIEQERGPTAPSHDTRPSPAASRGRDGCDAQQVARRELAILRTSCWLQPECSVRESRGRALAEKDAPFPPPRARLRRSSRTSATAADELPTVPPDDAVGAHYGAQGPDRATFRWAAERQPRCAGCVQQALPRAARPSNLRAPPHPRDVARGVQTALRWLLTGVQQRRWLLKRGSLVCCLLRPTRAVSNGAAGSESAAAR